jgi:hypothetical protein
MVKSAPPTVPPEIRNNLKLSPYFKKCIGAVDGSHIPSMAPEDETRLSFLPQNVLEMGNFQLTLHF